MRTTQNGMREEANIVVVTTLAITKEVLPISILEYVAEIIVNDDAASPMSPYSGSKLQLKVGFSFSMASNDIGGYEMINDQIILCTIIPSLYKSILYDVVGLSTSRNVWQLPETMFLAHSQARIVYYQS